MTFNAASRLRSLEDRSAALGSSRCELPGMHSVPKSAVLPYASGVGGLSRRLLNILVSVCLRVIVPVCVCVCVCLRASFLCPCSSNASLLGGQRFNKFRASAL